MTVPIIGQSDQPQYAVVMNVSPKPIPRLWSLGKKVQRKLWDWQRRQHLTSPKVIRNKDGTIRETLYPLLEDEQDALPFLQQEKLDELEPHVGHFIFAFGAYGAPGCLWIMPEGWARIVVKRNPKHLTILNAKDQLPPGIEPRHHGPPPSTFEWTFGHKSLADLNASPPAEAAWLHGNVVNDGIVTEQGGMTSPVGGGLPGSSVSLVGTIPAVNELLK